MNLYRIYRTDEVGYDEYDSAVVAAESEDVALRMAPYMDEFLFWNGEQWVFNDEATYTEHGEYYRAWVQPEQVSVELIGTAKEGTGRGVIVASFNAG